ncbi:MAG: hypothetical protein K9L30_11340 [Desulfobacterales bacterium]|nr:hypothetical protein [Desulfobacterales bacterium]
MTKCKIVAGICGFVTKVEVAPSAGGKVSVKIKSGCPDVTKLSEELSEITPYEEIFKKICQTKTYELATKYLPHSACTVPSGILKAIEIEAGLALPKNVTIELEKE